MLICALCGALDKLHTYMLYSHFLKKKWKKSDFLEFFAVFWGNLLEFLARDKETEDLNKRHYSLSMASLSL